MERVRTQEMDSDRKQESECKDWEMENEGGNAGE